MASTQFPQVYKPDGKWYASFYRMEDAEKWVKRQKDAEKWEITFRRPERKS